jgi:hypothetical protein
VGDDMEYRQALREHFEKDGELVMGHRNSTSAEEILEICDKENNRLNHLDCQVACNQYCQMVRTKYGLPAGGFGNRPRYYMIAKTKSEQKMLVAGVCKNIAKRLEALKIKGQDIIEPRRINNTIKQIEQFIPEED